MPIEYQPAKLLLTLEGDEVDDFKSLLEFCLQGRAREEDAPSWRVREWAQRALMEIK